MSLLASTQTSLIWTIDNIFGLADSSRPLAVITGDTSGMALASAKLFVEEGAYVFVTGRKQEQIDAAVKVNPAQGAYACSIQEPTSTLLRFGSRSCKPSQQANTFCKRYLRDVSHAAAS